MEAPLHISFRDMDSTPALEDAVRSGAAKLQQLCDRIERCDVVIERPHRHHRHGQKVRVRVMLGVPGPAIAVSEDHENGYAAIRGAFRTARRQLEDHARR